ncbi:MAG: T9SS type A sorting domain-containing protein [Bacteroidales bacterium]|nr:T9SS type A sorting domain-containing protein [Bacteroidales bacterium]
MKKFLLSVIAIFAMTICGFAQPMPVCDNACAPHENDADYSTGVIPTYPTTFPVLHVGEAVDQCVSVKIPTTVDGGAIVSLASGTTISINNVTLNELVNLPAGLTACASANPMAANGTYTMHITGTPTQAGEFQLKLKVEIDGEVSGGFLPISIDAVNNGINTLGGVPTNITITVEGDGPVEPAPVADFTTNPEYEEILGAAYVRINQGESVTFTSTSTNADHIAWEFEGGDPATSNENTVTVTYRDLPSQYAFTATLTAYNADGTRSNSKLLYVIVLEGEDPNAVTASFTTNPEYTGAFGYYVLNIQAGTAVTYTNTSTNAAHIAWTFEGGDQETSTADEVTVTYATAGTFTTRLVAYNADEETNEATLTVMVTSEPIDPETVVASFTTNPAYTNNALSIEAGASVTYTNTSANADHIAWTFEGGEPATSTANEVIVTYATAGSYTATLVAYGSDDASSTATITVTVTETNPGDAVNENTISEISVYPNPTSSVINISAEGMQNITIMDMTGRVVMNKDVNSDFETINAEGFAKANYMVRIATAEGVVVKNIVVE